MKWFKPRKQMDKGFVAKLKLNLPMQIMLMTGGSPRLVVIGVDSCSEGRGFESQHHILDGYFSHLFVVKIVMFFLKKDGNKWTFLK